MVLAFCVSAPAVAGPWTIPKGAFWVKTGLFYQDTDQRFAATGGFDIATGESFSPGDRVPYFFDGRSTTLAVFTELGYGIGSRLDLRLVVPFFHTEFVDGVDPDRSPSTGLGDLRGFLRLRVTDGPWVTSVRVGIKAPTGKDQGFGDAEVVPTGEGQWDFELGAATGHSFYPTPAFVTAELGYRIRTENTENGFRPGNEWIASADAGFAYTDGGWGGKLRWDWLYGETIQAAGIRLDQRRKIMAVTPAVVYRFGGGVELEGGLQIPLWGRDYPAGVVGVVAVSYGFSP